MERYWLHFNTTFISLIPKIDNPNSFNLYRSVFLYDYIYKIIAKVIAMRVKRLLSETIYSEKFGFSSGRKTHEAVGLA
jgi:hypothetical protein